MKNLWFDLHRSQKPRRKPLDPFLILVVFGLWELESLAKLNVLFVWFGLNDEIIIVFNYYYLSMKMIRSNFTVTTRNCTPMRQRPGTNRKGWSPSPLWFRWFLNLLSVNMHAAVNLETCQLVSIWNLTDWRDSQSGIAFIIVALRSSHLSRFYLISLWLLMTSWWIIWTCVTRFVIESCHTNTYSRLVGRYVIRSIGRLAACVPSRSPARDGPLYDIRGFHHTPGLLGNDFLDYLQQTHLHHTPGGI